MSKELHQKGGNTGSHTSIARNECGHCYLMYATNYRILVNSEQNLYRMPQKIFELVN